MSSPMPSPALHQQPPAWLSEPSYPAHEQPFQDHAMQAFMSPSVGASRSQGSAAHVSQTLSSSTSAPVMQQQDSMYNSLPTYRFPPPPPGPIDALASSSKSSLRPGSAIIPSSGQFSNNYNANASFTTPASPAMSASVTFSSDIPSMQGPGTPLATPPITTQPYFFGTSSSSSEVMPSPSLQAASLKGHPAQAGIFKSAPPPPAIVTSHLPTVSLIDDSAGQLQPREYSDYESGKGLSSMPFGHEPTTGLLEPGHHFRSISSTGDHLGISYAPSAFPPPPPPPHPAHHSSTHLSPLVIPAGSGTAFYGQPHSAGSSTYMPSSAYLPSKATFANMSPAIPQVPRSAPSTPLGRQDARFLSAARGWSTPQPPLQAGAFLQVSSVPPNVGVPSSSSPMHPPLPGSASFAGGLASPAAFSTYQSSPIVSMSPDEYEAYEASSSFFGTPRSSLESPYVGFNGVQTPVKLSSGMHKRVSPFSPASPSDGVLKRVKKDRANGAMSSSPSYSDFMHSEDSKPKAQRVKIACGACRKTRLRCDGKSPCGSCVEKHIKAYPSDSVQDAKFKVQQEGLCSYENFIRRRGKGKKTLEKEREETMTRSLGSSATMNAFNGPEGGLFFVQGPDGTPHYGLGVTHSTRSGSSEYSL